MLLRNVVRQTSRRHTQAAVSKIAKNAPNVRNFSYIHWPIFSEEHVMIQESTRAFAEAELQPIAFDVSDSKWTNKFPNTNTHAHTHIYIYIYIYLFMYMALLLTYTLLDNIISCDNPFL